MNSHPQLAPLAAEFARDLARLAPSRDLDARIEELVAAGVKNDSVPAPRRSVSPPRWLLAACVTGLAIGTGIVIGLQLGARGRAQPAVAAVGPAREPAWPPPEFALWPTDSVALKVPAEFAPDGTLVAVDARAQTGGTRYWVDIIVSNDGTVRIENIVPAGRRNEHGVTLQTP